MIRGLEAGKRPALLISECQRGVLDPTLSSLGELANQVAQRDVLTKIAGLAALFRAAGCPVVHAHIGHRPDFGGYAMTNPLLAIGRRGGGMIAGSANAEPMPDVAPVDGDLVSSRSSGLTMWIGTELDSIMRSEHVDTIVFTGVSTNLAIFAGALIAGDLGYQSVIVEDASAGATAETHEWMVPNALSLLASLSNTAAVSDAMRARARD